MKRTLGIFLCSLLMQTLVFAAVCKTEREVYIENKDTKVWKTTICPHEILAYHRHNFPRVVIPQNDGVLQVVYSSGERKNLQLQQQIPVFLDYAQGQELHQDINPGDKPVKVLVIELKKEAT